MSFASFISSRISFKSNRTYSKLIVRIAIIGIMLSLGVMILSVAIIRGFKQEIRQKLRGFAGDIQVQNYDNNNSYQASPIHMDNDFVKKIRSSSLFTNIAPTVIKPGIIKTKTEIEGVVIKGVNKDYDWTFFKKMMVSGKVIDFADTADAQKQVMISSYTASRLKLKVGDKFLMYFVQESLRKRPFYVKGIFDVGVEEVDKTFVIGDLSLLVKLNNWDADEIGGYQLQVADFDKLNTANDFLADKMPLKLKSYTVTESYPTIFVWLSELDLNAEVMLILMILVGTINMISALLIIILERTSMIGILKAMGAKNWTIQKIFLYNASYLVGIGLVLGNVFGLGISLFQHRTHFFTLDEASYYMKFVPMQLHWSDVLLLNLGTMVICILVLIIPSMLVAKISPVKAIRFK
ncbi:ABC transporter permease [Mucilaginibacter ginsenosidivorans]|uniref:ABC transporter permease n=1 Tax=Mucilaginibacter ginsenosidivorans TaxID=398053 RepID=A0A5B8V3J4_9SPHI|nr:FtsX-like permease family protein [Mucilaginibacter ginsenosidivorans]QEC65739.1 ABC transporter permease [Mucilaginibacter ginsenosidivorans]